MMKTFNNKLTCFFFYLNSYRLVDIICDKMAEGGENETSASSNATHGTGSTGGPNIRGGPTTGATRLTDSLNNQPGASNQSCQC